MQQLHQMDTQCEQFASKCHQAQNEVENAKVMEIEKDIFEMHQKMKEKALAFEK